MSVGAVVTTGIGGGSSRALLTTVGYRPSFIAPPAPPAVVGGMVKRRRGKYEIEIDGRRFVAASAPALEGMVARWRQTRSAVVIPILTPTERVPKPRKGVISDSGASDPRSISLPADTATPSVVIEMPGAVVLPPNQLETATQALAAQATLARAIEVENQALAAQMGEMQRLLMEAEEDDVESVMAILKALGYG